MMLFAYATFFLLGTIVASFMGVVAVRLHTGQSFFVGRSRCDACDTHLSPLSLVPVFSYLICGGRAKCCGARFSVWAPLSEIILGSLFVGSYATLGLVWALVPMLLALSVLLGLVLYDLTHQILPPTLLYTFVILSALTRYLISPTWSEFSTTLVQALLTGGTLALIHVLSRGRAMGFADAPLAFALSLLVGPIAFSGFVFSFWIGAVVGLGILARRPVGSRMGVEVPFAPFLAAGFLLAYFTQWNLFTFVVNISGH